MSLFGMHAEYYGRIVRFFFESPAAAKEGVLCM